MSENNKSSEQTITAQERIDELRRAVSSNADAPELAELLPLLAASEPLRAEGRELCFRALAADPRNLVVRLQLARLFYLDRLGEFCVRELLELKKYTNASSLDRLLEAFGDFAKPFLPTGAGTMRGAARPNVAAAGAVPAAVGPARSKEAVVAELDVDFSDVLDEIEEEGQ